MILTLLLGRATAAPPSDAVDSYVESQVASRHLPGLSRGVVRDGKVVFARGYGMANLELSVPATPETVYELASVSKQFTATAVMMLVEEGKLKLDDPITRHLPQAPKAWQGVTVRNLLNHTSGIKDYLGRRTSHSATITRTTNWSAGSPDLPSSSRRARSGPIRTPTTCCSGC